jgi:homoserine O-acetyltransferase
MMTAQTYSKKKAKPLFKHQQKVFKYPHLFILESGETLSGFHLFYETFGTLNAAKDNIIWFFHALTGNSNPLEWWSGLAGVGKLFDPQKHFIICVNMPGSHYGSINPLSINSVNEKPYYHSFPTITTRDMAKMYQFLQQSLQIEKIQLGIGGSMGGMQLLEWSILQPSIFKNITLIATNAFHSPWGIAFNETQRMAIETDKTWEQKNAAAGMQGLATARAIALLSYRHYNPFKQTQSEPSNNKIENFKASSYQRYQGEKLKLRFNAFSYYSLTKSMDSHNVGRNRESVANALKKITANTLVVGIESDILFPIEEQEYLAENITNAKFSSIHSIYGHDGFLIEYEKLEKIIRIFLML